MKVEGAIKSNLNRDVQSKIRTEDLKMYVTRPLSMYRKSPSMLEAGPPDGPHSGYLVITDEEADEQDMLCWGSCGCCGICQRKSVKNLPFAQDKILTVVYTSEHRETSTTNVWFVPVPNLPLSSNRYFIIRAKGRHKGKACRCSRQRDITACCFGDISRDEKPKPLNLRDAYQQFKISHHHHGSGYFAKSVVPDGVAPRFLRRKGWTVRCSSLNRLKLGEASGLDTEARARLPEFGFSAFESRSGRVEVGRWHCPFPFVRERGVGVRRQMRDSMFYTMTLEQWWEEIFSVGNVRTGEERSVVNVDVEVQREVVLVGGLEGVRVDESSGAMMSWFRVYNPYGKRGVISVGLSYAIVDHMRWVLEEGGWVGGGDRGGEVEKEANVVRAEERVGSWKRFGCYVLVESFVLRRLDGSLVLKCSFRHTHRIRCKWE